MDTPRFVELRFHLVGDTIPVDHGYHLYSSLSQELASIHESKELSIGLIRGRYAGNGKLELLVNSYLTVRTPVEQLPGLLALAGKKLLIDGHSLRLGTPQTVLLKPAAALYSHLVTTRNGQDETRFDAEIRRQLTELGIEGNLTRGPRRTFSVHEKKVVGYSLLVDQLSAEESIKLQESGLGGRRKMGCGIFSPRR